MKRKIVLMLCAAALVLTATPAAAGPPPELTTLEPGGFRSIEQDLTINVVFVGFGGYAIDETAFEDALPAEYRVVHRYPWYYGSTEFLGNDFAFDYNLIFADGAFEDDFFAWLGAQGYEDAPTAYQGYYNAQVNNVLDVTAPVRYIDGPSVENWLETNGASMMGDYTVFLVNWWDRPDFQFHVYTKFGEPDPDTGVDFGQQYHSRKLIAWGGSTGRTWFYDFSAGPEYNSGNYLIDNPPGYIIPPIWEYGSFRALSELTGDMAGITRYVAINLLFTPSPLYKPLLSPPDLPASIDLDINLFEADPDNPGAIDLAHIEAQYDAFQPYKDYTVDFEYNPLRSRHDQVFDCFAADADSCYGQRLFNIAFGDLFLYVTDHLVKYLDGDADYEIPLFLYNTTPQKLGAQLGLLGFADDDWATGTQTYVFEFGNWYYRGLGFGFSNTAVHEAGHHIGLSHPHDGYDYEGNFQYGGSGPFYYVWVGDESDTIMHYLDLSWGFGVFNQDSQYRWETAGYINTANAILADIYANPRAGRVSTLLTSADIHAADALVAYQAMDYLTAVQEAQAAYGDVLAAADEIHVPVEPQSWQSDYKGRGMQFHVDPIRYPFE